MKLGNGGPDLQCERLGNWSLRGVRIRRAHDERNDETSYELHDRMERGRDRDEKRERKNREKD